MPAATRAIDEPVRQRSLRTHNLGLVLRQVAACPDPVSRAELSATTGLTKATVSTLVDELIGGGLLAEVGPAPRTGAGRPAVGLRLATAVAPAGLGLEINVDYLSCAVVDLTGAVRHRATHWADQRGRSPAQVGHDLGDLVAMACAQAGAQRLDLAGVALAVPGLVAEGVVRVAPNLGWREVELRSWLPDALRDLPGDLPVTVDNEANLATLAELATLGAGEPDSFLYISGEIGVGAGLVLHGRLVRGGRGYAGELGHVPIHPDGPRCRCGALGCLEVYANQEALLSAAAVQPAGAGGTGLADLAALARSGSEPALAALAGAGTALGVAAAGAVNLLDLPMVVLGGGYAQLAPWLIGPVCRELSARVLTAPWAPVTVRASRLGGDAAVLGAAGSVIRAILDAPAQWLARPAAATAPVSNARAMWSKHTS